MYGVGSFKPNEGKGLVFGGALEEMMVRETNDTTSKTHN